MTDKKVPEVQQPKVQQPQDVQEVNFLRHANWVGQEDLNKKLIIVGCGAVGSWVAYLAACMGYHQFELWDDDAVEDYNLPNQAFDLEHIGMDKTQALENVLRRFNPNIDVTRRNTRLTSEYIEKEGIVLEGTMVIATDSMLSRADLLKVFFMNPLISYVFEVRLGFTFGELNIIDNLDIASCGIYKQGLKSDDEIEEGPCNQRLCVTLVTTVASQVVHSLCEKAVAERDGAIWQPKKQTLFNLDTGVLQTFYPQRKIQSSELDELVLP